MGEHWRRDPPARLIAVPARRLEHRLESGRPCDHGGDIGAVAHAVRHATPTETARTARGLRMVERRAAPVSAGTFASSCGLSLVSVVSRGNVSGADEHDGAGGPGRETATGRGPSSGAAHRPADSDDAAIERDTDLDTDLHLDLGDLDALGVDGMVARLRGGGGDDTPVEAPARRVSRGRSPVLSVLIACAGVALLVWMFPDFRYGVRSREPELLGHASELAVDGKMPPGLHDRYVRISGTPDVQHAARLTTAAGTYVGYLRINEGGGSLFAAIPRGKDEAVRDEFEGTFEGRMLRLDRDDAADWIDEYLRDQNVVRTVDSTVAALIAAVGGTGERRTLASDGREVQVGLGERIRVVVHPPDARVQLGLSSYRDPEDAAKRVAALGYPWISAGTGKAFHSFIVRIPEAERPAATARLLEGIEVTESNVDPRRGALILPGTVAFSAALGDYVVDGDEVQLPRTTAGGPTLYDAVGTTLVPRAGVDGRVSIPRSWISAVRIEQPITLDRDGYLVVVGDTPDKHWLPVLLWLIVLALVVVNAAGIVGHVRRSGAG